MPHFEAFTLVKWLHLAAFSVAGGGAVLAVVLSGGEEGRTGFTLSAALWKGVVAWGFRLAFLLGITLLVMNLRGNPHPFDAHYLPLKAILAFCLLGVSEATPRSLAAGKRSSALLAVVLFLLTTFVSVNAGAFGTAIRRIPTDPGAGVYQAQ